MEEKFQSRLKEHISHFTDTVWSAYKTSTRIDMPWRKNHNPYYVLLSEMMLQQTQITRVVDYFHAFTDRWPCLCDIAEAPLGDVLEAWMGLGYYRRAKYLHACAMAICKNHKGVVPRDKEVLLTLPGIGDYTSSAILAFAYNISAVVVETNIRRAIIHHFFEGETRVLEKDVREYVQLTMDRARPRLWYWALMDYGASLIYKVQNPNRRSAIYIRQSKFEGSNRQVRAAILRVLVREERMHAGDIVDAVRKTLTKTETKDEVIYHNIGKLAEEQLMVCEGDVYYVK